MPIRSPWSGQFRICFVWTDANAEEVEIVDYHCSAAAQTDLPRRDAGRGIPEAARDEQLPLGEGNRGAGTAYRRDRCREALHHRRYRPTPVPILRTLRWMVVAIASSSRHAESPSRIGQAVGAHQAAEGLGGRNSAKDARDSRPIVLRQSAMLRTRWLAPPIPFASRS